MKIQRKDWIYEVNQPPKPIFRNEQDCDSSVGSGKLLVGQTVKISIPLDKPEISLNDLATEKPTLDSQISEVNMQLN